MAIAHFSNEGYIKNYGKIPETKKILTFFETEGIQCEGTFCLAFRYLLEI